MSHPNDDADDLDAFFDEVEEQVEAVEAVEGKVEQEEKNEKADPNGHYKNFLEKEDADTTTVVHPPSKKIKPTIVPPPPIPKGVVVASAAAAAATSTVATSGSSNSTGTGTGTGTTGTVPYSVIPSTHHYGMIPPPPPPPPPLQQLNTIGHTMTGTNHHATMAVPLSSTSTNGNNTTTTTTKGNSSKPHIRSVAGKVWVDPSLADWPDDDFRIFVGNLDPTVTDQQLYDHFAPHYPSLHQVRIIRDKKKNQTSLGYGFCSLLDPLECARAIREQDQTWLGGRPIRIKRSHWKDRELSSSSTSQPLRNTKAKKKRR